MGGVRMLTLKRKVFSLNNQYSVFNSNNNIVYTACGKYLSLWKSIRLYDNSGNEIFVIKKRPFHIMPEYDVYSQGQLFAKLKRKFFYGKYVLLIFNGPSIQIAESQLWSKRFTIYNGNTPIIIIQKFLAFAHIYSIEYSNDQNPALSVAYGIIIDMIFRKYSR